MLKDFTASKFKAEVEGRRHLAPAGAANNLLSILSILYPLSPPAPSTGLLILLLSHPNLC